MADKSKTTTTAAANTMAVWRERMGYSVEDAAKALGMGPTTVANMEASDAELPRYVRLAMAALAMGMEPID